MKDEPKSDAVNRQELPGLVVVGSSAGGIDAVLTLVGSLPAEFPAPVVIAQHIDPHRPSRLNELLSNRTSLDVRTTSDHEPLEPGTIYVVPADRDVEITDHHLGVRENSGARSHPSVNRLMSTAASAFGERLIGVVLTGTGFDGAEGTQAIKEHGGTVIIQNPDTAEFSGMPAAVPPSVVDVVAELDDIGGLLVEFFGNSYAIPEPDGDGRDELGTFLENIRENTGLDFGAYKRPTIERRLQRRMVAVGTHSLDEYRKHIANDPDEMQRLIDTFLIKVTRFFRDPEFYEHLRDHVLPDLIAGAKESGELRLWSAGCATGEEAYTLAILLTDMLEAEDASISVRIFATDVAREAIEFARRGVYPSAALADMPPELTKRHFICHNGTCEVRKKARGMVVFGEHDLSRRAPFPRIDLVLCRNVLIYFTPELQRRTLQLFAFSLRTGGLLVVGKAESVKALPEFFELADSRLKMFRRIGAQVPIPVARFLDDPAPQVPKLHTRNNRSSRSAGEQHSSATEVLHAYRYSPTLLDLLTTGIVLVDRNYDIQLINATARRLLGVVGSGINDDLVHRVVQVLAEPIRAAIDAAFTGETITETLQKSGDILDDHDSDLVIRCAPVTMNNHADAIDTVIVEVSDVTSFAERDRNMRSERDGLLVEKDAFTHRVAAASSTIRDLREADHDMAIDLTRLRAENEQLLIATEEAQASTEEIETVSEEQQATSEELETLNEELQATVEELNTTNADLEARSHEQEELATRLDDQRHESEAERERLAAILANIGDAVLVVDDAGEVIQTNEAWRQFLGPVTEFAPEDEHGRPLPQDNWPHRRAVRGEELTMQFSLPGDDGGRRWFEAHSQPVTQGNGQPTWGVVVVRDITERSLRRMQERFIAVASHELRTPMTSLSGSLQLLARRLTDAERETALGKHVGRAQEQMRRMESLIGELTDVARLQGGTFRLETSPVDLATTVKHAATIASEMSDPLELRTSVPDQPVMVEADAYRLEQVFLNLIINASRHARSDKGIDLRLFIEDCAAVVEVEDYGAGIPKGALPDIFSQFYQTSNDDQTTKGLGLGLFIVQEIVNAHGGSISVRSDVGEGATFTVRLPLLQT